jgi:Spy/CpxP family protein refolding chaperone
MIKMRLEASTAVAAALLGLFALPAISHAQSALIASTSTRTPMAFTGQATAGQPDNSNAIAGTPHLSGGAAAHPSPQRDLVQIEDYIMSLTLTDAQRAQIGQIHQDMKNRMDRVARDSNETTDQKEAMIDGLRRMRLRQIFLVLTPEQRSELRKKFSSRSSDAPPQGSMIQQTSPK